MTSDRLPLALMLVLIGVLALGVLVVARPPAPNQGGVPHPEFATMQAGGDADRHSDLLLPVWGMGALIVTLFVGLLRLGLGTSAGRGAASRWLWAGWALYLGVWSALVWTYAGDMGRADLVLFGSFPPASAWMLYGLWPAPLLLLILYVVNFDRWVLRGVDAHVVDGPSAASRGRASRPDED